MVRLRNIVAGFVALVTALVVVVVAAPPTVNADARSTLVDSLVAPCLVDPTDFAAAPAECGVRHRLAAFVVFDQLDRSDRNVQTAEEHLVAGLVHLIGDQWASRDGIHRDFQAANALEKLNGDTADADLAMRYLTIADGIAAARIVDRLERAAGAGLMSADDIPGSLDVHLAAGAADLAAGEYSKAIASYRSAWTVANGALTEFVDPDGDVIPTEVELQLGTDPNLIDSDGDGLSDLTEIWTTFTDPTLGSTDGALPDGGSDIDEDGLTVLEEFEAGSDPLKPDTDGDTLRDGDEVAIGTDPSDTDTDTDRLTDDAELRLGTDPLDPDTDDDGVLDGDEVYTTALDDADVGLRLTITGVGDVASTVHVEPRSSVSAFGDSPFLVSEVVDLSTPASFGTAEVTLTFDPSEVPGGDVDGLVLAYYDEELGLWVPLPSSVDTATNTVTGTTDHFTVFSVLFFPGFIQSLRDFEPPDGGGGGGGGGASSLDIVLALDSSGSMASNDPAGVRRTSSKNFIDQLADDDRVGVVDFDSSARVFQSLTTDKAAAKAAVDRVNSSGGTNIGAAVNVSNLEHINNGDPDHAAVTILLTDGDGSYNPAFTQVAIDNGIRICTVGLGSGPNAALLTQIAEATGCQYFAAAQASDLNDIFDDLPDDIDPNGDLDGDGLANGIEVDGILLGTGATVFTDPRNPDTDGDGLLDGEEVRLTQHFDPAIDPEPVSYYYVVTDPANADSDGDLLSDGEEQPFGTTTPALDPDQDDDGLLDGVEIFGGFDPHLANADGDSYPDAVEWEKGQDPYTYDLAGEDQARAFVAGGILGEFGSEVGEFSTSLKTLIGDAVGLIGGDLGDAVGGLINFVIGGSTDVGCFVGGVVGFVNPFGGSPTDAICDILNYEIVWHPEYFSSLSYLAGWVAVSLIPFVDIVASIRDVVGALIKGDFVGAGLEFIFGIVGFVAPVAGDLPGIAGKVIKFLAKADQLVGAVFGYVVKRFSDAGTVIVKDLIQRIAPELTEEVIDEVGGVDVVIELLRRNTNPKHLKFLIDNGGALRRFAPSTTNITNRVRNSWTTVTGRNLDRVVAQAVGTEAAVEILEARGYRVLYSDSNIPRVVDDAGTVRAIPNGPDIIAVSPDGTTVIVEAKGSIQANGTSISRSTIESTNQNLVQAGRGWLTDKPERYLATLVESAEATGDPALTEAVTRLRAIIIDDAEYDVIITAASTRPRFGGTAVAAVAGDGPDTLRNGGSVELWELELDPQVLSDVRNYLDP